MKIHKDLVWRIATASRRTAVGFGLLSLISGCGGGGGDNDAFSSSGTSTRSASQICDSLVGLKVSKESIGLPTSGATINSASLVLRKDPGNTSGEYCKILATIQPVDQNAPNIRVALNLPTEFNGKAVHFGGGGTDGYLGDPANFPVHAFAGYAAPAGVQAPLARGFVTYTSDSGHEGTGFDAFFASNDEALENYAFAHIKKTHDFAVFVSKLRYGTNFSHSYFMGGSGGGRQALLAAQRYPKDYDGIVATHPASSLTGIWLQMGRVSKSLFAPGGFVNPTKATMLASSVIKTCDAFDGIVDGIISNPKACVFDPISVRCPSGSDTGDLCLSDLQIVTMKAAATPLKTDFSLANNLKGFPAFAEAFSGADFSTVWYGPTASEAMISPAIPGKTSFFYSFSNDMLRFAVARDPNVSILGSFDPESPGKYTARIQELSSQMDSTSSDLNVFQAGGGKLILQHGTSDQDIPAQHTIDYYQSLLSRYGMSNLSRFVKFYLVPGAAHQQGGQFNGSYDSLTALDDWVIRGIEPKNLEITDMSEDKAFRTRPLCEFPTYPKYVFGDPGRASSFSCVN